MSGYEPELGSHSGCDAVTYAQYRALQEPPPPDTRIRFVRSSMAGYNLRTPSSRG